MKSLGPIPVTLLKYLPKNDCVGKLNSLLISLIGLLFLYRRTIICIVTNPSISFDALTPVNIEVMELRYFVVIASLSA